MNEGPLHIRISRHDAPSGAQWQVFTYDPASEAEDYLIAFSGLSGLSDARDWAREEFGVRKWERTEATEIEGVATRVPA
jgi:hypothetical protein